MNKQLNNRMHPYLFTYVDRGIHLLTAAPCCNKLQQIFGVHAVDIRVMFGTKDVLIGNLKEKILIFLYYTA